MGHNYQEYYIRNLMDKYSDLVYRLCFIYLRNKADAEDAFQETFIKAIEKAPSFMNAEHEKAWMITVTSNHCKNLFRKRKRENAVILDENYYIANDDLHNNQLLPIILNLPLEYRNVIYLYYYEGYSTKEIAIILNHKDSTIRTWLKRAREDLKIRIGGDFNE